LPKKLGARLAHRGGSGEAGEVNYQRGNWAQFCFKAKIWGKTEEQEPGSTDLEKKGKQGARFLPPSKDWGRGCLRVVPPIGLAAFLEVCGDESLVGGPLLKKRENGD